MDVNGGDARSISGIEPATSRADEVQNLLTAVQDQVVQFIRAADDEIQTHESNVTLRRSSALLERHAADELYSRFDLSLPSAGTGSTGLLNALQSILQYSVNTFSPGFLDKLYSATNAPGLAAELILAALNTNVHVYQVSPVLTLVEKKVGRQLALMFGLSGTRSGGISCQGGSASNLTSIVVARNTLHPSTKVYGNHVGGLELVLLTSAHAHYSIEKAAQACGFGSASVISVPVDPKTGTMIPEDLDRAISVSKTQGKTPFYVNATAGSTVFGSFDPFTEIAWICQKHKIWFHIDASWGGPFIFSPTLKHNLKGSELADSIAINPHKMMAVPLTCSFLLAKDLQQFHAANTLPAGYLFHSDTEVNGTNKTGKELTTESAWHEPLDQADLTLQCGRRGDSLKLFLSWQYYGTSGYSKMITEAHTVASHLAQLVADHPDLLLISENPPPCLQVCFYYAPGQKMTFHPHLFGNAVDHDEAEAEASSVTASSPNSSSPAAAADLNSRVTSAITSHLIPRGFMIDYAPPVDSTGTENTSRTPSSRPTTFTTAKGSDNDSLSSPPPPPPQKWMGKFFRVVVNVNTSRSTVERLVKELCEIGSQIVAEERGKVRNTSI